MKSDSSQLKTGAGFPQVGSVRYVFMFKDCQWKFNGINSFEIAGKLFRIRKFLMARSSPPEVT